MKKLIITLLLGLAAFFLSRFIEFDPVIASLHGFHTREFYTSGGFQDYTDYGKYAYRSAPIRALQNSEYFKETTDALLPDLLSYIDNFEGWVSLCGRKLLQNYDFARSCVSAGDYFHLKTKEGQPIGSSAYGKFDSYTLYYFDLETRTLYYFHSNI